jgi:hypothetical protein
MIAQATNHVFSISRKRSNDEESLPGSPTIFEEPNKRNIQEHHTPAAKAIWGSVHWVRGTLKA